MVSLNIRKIPEKLRREFKTVCVNQGKTMSDVIQEFMKEKIIKFKMKFENQ